MDSSQIFEAVSRARTENIAAINILQGECSLDRYAHLMRTARVKYGRTRFRLRLMKTASFAYLRAKCLT